MNQIQNSTPPKFRPFLAFLVPCLAAWVLLPIFWFYKPLAIIYLSNLPLSYALAFVGVNWSTYQGNRQKLWVGLRTFFLAFVLTFLIVLFFIKISWGLPEFSVLLLSVFMPFLAWVGTAMSVWWIRRLTKMPSTRESRWVVFAVCLLVGAWSSLSLHEFWKEVFGIDIHHYKEFLPIFNLGWLFGLTQVAYAWLIYKGQKMAFERTNLRVESEQAPLK